MNRRHRVAAIWSAISILFTAAAGAGALRADAGVGKQYRTTTPIHHLVVIFQENNSFDHYFGTYPFALNPPGEPPFMAKPGTPSVNSLGMIRQGSPVGTLLTSNPNRRNPANGKWAMNPFRLDRTQASTCDQDHTYGHEQQAFDEGLMDLFPVSTGNGLCDHGFDYGKEKALVMGYFDGNTVTALWNYAQTYAMSDNSYGSTFGPSTPGLLNLVAGNTYPATPSAPTSNVVNVVNGAGTLVNDTDPTGDRCSHGTTITMGGRNIGDLLTAASIPWGAFMGGFDLKIVNPNGSTGCDRQSPATPAHGGPINDYLPHHAFFQYWKSTANFSHARPSVPPAQYGINGDAANHQYDIHDFLDALNAGNLPAVNFLKAPAAMDGHAGYSDPLLEQRFIVNTVNAIQRSAFWKNTAIIVLYDDSDGWYDHQMGPIVNPSAVPPAAGGQARESDQLNGPGKCGNGVPLKNDNGIPIEGRCGYGMRQPFVVISPYAKRNFVDHTLIDQSSVIRFIEDNWGLKRVGNGSFDALAGRITNMFDFSHKCSECRLILDPETGEPQSRRSRAYW